MQYTTLGRSGLRASRLCLGTMNFGNSVSEEEAFKIMDCAREAGLNFFDTADLYGKNWGDTETVIGKWFAKGGGRREDTVLATKCYFGLGGSANPNDESCLSGYKIKRRLEQSMKRLGTDHVELYLMHKPDPLCPVDELVETYQSLVYRGLIDYVGSCSFTAYDLCRFQYESEKHHFFGLACEQHGYNLLNRKMEVEVAGAAQKLGIGITIYTPQCGGLLGNNVFNPRPGSRSDAFKLDEDSTAMLKKYHALCSDIGQTPSHVALAWVMSNPAVTCPLVGVSSAAQLEDNIYVMENVKLSQEVLDALDEIFPPIPEFNYLRYKKETPAYVGHNKV